MMFSLRVHPAAGIALAAFVWLCAVPVSAQAPTLADLAKKEQERRKSTPSPQKVYTNKDLPKSATTPPQAAAPAPAPGAPAAPGADAAATEQKPEGDAEVKDEKWWHARAAELRDDISKNEMFLDALQTRVNSLSNDFVSRDDPAQRAKIAEDRQRALVMMDRVKGDIEKGKQALADLEEEARKAGVPPGWLR